MKITDVAVYVVPAELSVTSWVNGDPWILVELQTDSGISGWGQAHTESYGREHAIARKAHDFAQAMDGMNPLSIKRFMLSADDRISTSPDGIEHSAAAAGIEIALWDIVGKALGTPVHHLLGGPCSEHIRLYANCWSNRIREPDELASFADQQIRRGFKAVKIYPLLHDVCVRHGMDCVRAVRETVGPDVEIFVDMLGQMPPEHATDIFQALRALGVSWLEDPAPSSDIQTLYRIRRQCGMPVVTGEDIYTREGFARLCDARAVDVLNPEVALLGILGLKDVATIAEFHSLNIAVHNANTMTIGLAAAMHAATTIPNVPWVEFFPTLEVGSNVFSEFPLEIDQAGCAQVPREPGLGVTVDKAALENFRVDV